MKAQSKNKAQELNRIMGMPIRWDRKNIFKNFWNPEDDRIFPPKYFGIGWDLNTHALLKRAGVIKKQKAS